MLVHAGGLGWLEPPFRPRRDVNLVADPAASLAPEVQQHIRRAAVEALATVAPPAIHDTGDALMQRMMSVCLGESVPPEYARLTREEMALAPKRLGWPANVARPAGRDDHVLIVGVGVGVGVGAGVVAWPMRAHGPLRAAAFGLST